jgi:Zn-dependent protease
VNGILESAGLDLALIVAGMLLIAAAYAWMLRRARPMLSVERDGLQVDHRHLPWAEVESVAYSRGSMGALLRVTTRHGLLAFREDQLIQHPDDVRRKLVSGAGLVRQTEVEIPKGLVHDPGDIYEEWRRPTPEEFAAFTQGGTRTLAPRTASPSTTPKGKDNAKKAAVGLAALLALLAKFGKALAVGLKFVFGSAKLGGLMPTALSMLASVWLYAQAWGWWFAVGFVLLLLLHELGHAAVIKAKGLRTSPIVFLPFVGALISIKDQFRDASVEAEMAWGGPAIGALTASACYLAFVGTGNEFWLHLAYVGFLLNLFNLLPISPLDGGRVVAAISTWLWVPGLLLGGLLAVKIGHPILVVIVVLGALRAISDWQRRRRGAAGDYYDMSLRYRALMSTAYFGLIGFLGWMTLHAHTVAQAGLDAR